MGTISTTSSRVLRGKEGVRTQLFNRTSCIVTEGTMSLLTVFPYQANLADRKRLGRAPLELQGGEGHSR